MYIGKSPTVPCTLKVDSSIFRSATVMMDAKSTYHMTSTILMSTAMVTSYWMGLPLLGAYFCTWLAYIGKSLTVPCTLKVDFHIQEYYGNDGCDIDIPYDEYNNNVDGNGNFLLDGSTSIRRISVYFCTWLAYIGESLTVPGTLKVDSRPIIHSRLHPSRFKTSAILIS
jgi:hypothetical protein